MREKAPRGRPPTDMQVLAAATDILRIAAEYDGGRGRSLTGTTRGRPIVPDADRLRIHNIRLTRAQIEKLARLGGAAWIRQKIDRAKIPPEAK